MMIDDHDHDDDDAKTRRDDQNDWMVMIYASDVVYAP